MKTRIHYRLMSLVATFILASLILTGTASAQNRRRQPPPVIKPPTPGIWLKNAGGAMLGPWFTDELGRDISDPNYRLSATSTAFHLELFYQPHLTGNLNLDLNFGTVGRGDLRVTINTPSGPVSSFGDATLYPIGLGVMWFPFARSERTRVQPMFRAGGSLIIGTERLEAIIEDQFGYYYGVSSESRVAAGFYAATGVYWVLGSQFALTGNVKYQHAKFSKELFGVRDYSGVQVLIGAAYLYR